MERGSTNQFCSQTERYFGILLLKNWRKSRKRSFNSSFLIWDSFISCPTLVRGRNHADLPFVFKNYQNIDHDGLAEDGTGHLSLLNMKLAAILFLWSTLSFIYLFLSLMLFVLFYVQATSFWLALVSVIRTSCKWSQSC